MPRPSLRWLLAAALALTACTPEEEPPPDDSSSGLITTLSLVFTPSDGGDDLEFVWTDPEGDGDPEVDEIPLPDGSSHDHHHEQEYELRVDLWNDLEDPALDVRDEIEDAPEGYQLFFSGTAVDGPATDENDDAILLHEYADEDDDGFPVGLESEVATLAWGDGDLTVTVARFSDDGVVKEEGLAEDVARDGFDIIDDAIVLQVTFDVTVE